MKKVSLITTIAVGLVILLLAGAVAAIPARNDQIARDVEKELTDLPLPQDTEMIESISRAGKLVGNGNGMQYFGAMLIKSEQSAKELSAYYGDKLEGIIVKAQTAQTIECVEHDTLAFESAVGEEGYYIVYRFGNKSSAWLNMDLRGH